MQIKDLFEQTPAPVNPDTSLGKSEEIGKLTATVSSLQKQIADLQKSALQQSSAQQASKPGEAGQQQQATGSIGSGAGNSTVAQKTATGQDAGMLDMVKKLAGLDKTATQPVSTAAPQTQPAPGVNQPPQITDLKIKQDLAKTQGKST